MMIKVNGEYLDFNDDVEVESQIKLFEDISTSNGDYSYSFELSKTTKNLKALGLPFPDTVKSIYQNVRCELVDESGFKIHSGGLQVNKITDVISCTFFGGNNDWFGLLSDPLSSLPLYKYDVDLTVSNILSSWNNSKGLVFPIIDTGGLITRSFRSLMVDDFTSCLYVKDIMNDIFAPQGIKLEGDLMEDWLYNNTTVAANGRSQEEVRSRSAYVKKTTLQTISGLTKVTFQDESTFPYFDGSKGNFALSTYTADVRMRIRVDLSFTETAGVSSTGIYIYKNGVAIITFINTLTGPEVFTRTATINIEAGDTVEIYANQTIGTFDIISGSIKITPTYIYKIFGNSSVPNWTQGEFVSNILRILNVLPSYNANNKTLTLDLFNKIKTKQEFDVSDFVTIEEIDFTEFVSPYGKNNIFKYQESNDEDLREYNISNFISYGSGILTVNNDFIESSVDVVESDFTSPITYLNGVFDMSMERINFVELEEVDDKAITSVSVSGGSIRFNMSNADQLFTDGDLVRIKTNLDGYTGDWVINAVTSTFISVIGLDFDVTSTGTATLLRHKFTSDNNVYLFVNVPTVQNLFFSSNYSMTIDDFPFTLCSIAYFNLISNGREINTKFKQSLSFGTVNNPLSYQQTILQTYWPIFSAILNDPVMLKVSAYFNRKTYEELKTFLRPLRVKTNETNNLYYLNRITGYKSGHEPCEGKLIKL